MSACEHCHALLENERVTRRERDAYRLAAQILGENLNDAFGVIDVLTSQLLAYRAADAAVIVAFAEREPRS
jgi:hypothetical protein